MTKLQRLVLDYRTGALIVHALYRTQDGLGPGTVRRRREVADLVREGLQGALAAHESVRVDVVGTGRYTTREDTVLCITRNLEIVHKTEKRGA